MKIFTVKECECNSWFDLSFPQFSCCQKKVFNTFHLIIGSLTIIYSKKSTSQNRAFVSRFYMSKVQVFFEIISKLIKDWWKNKIDYFIDHNLIPFHHCNYILTNKIYSRWQIMAKVSSCSHGKKIKPQAFLQVECQISFWWENVDSTTSILTAVVSPTMIHLLR